MIDDHTVAERKKQEQRENSTNFRRNLPSQYPSGECDTAAVEQEHGLGELDDDRQHLIPGMCACRSTQLSLWPLVI